MKVSVAVIEPPPAGHLRTWPEKLVRYMQYCYRLDPMISKMVHLTKYLFFCMDTKPEVEGRPVYSGYDGRRPDGVAFFFVAYRWWQVSRQMYLGHSVQVTRLLVL